MSIELYSTQHLLGSLLQMPRKWWGNGGDDDQNSDVVCIKRDIERVG